MWKTLIIIITILVVIGCTYLHHHNLLIIKYEKKMIIPFVPYDLDKSYAENEEIQRQQALTKPVERHISLNTSRAIVLIFILGGIWLGSNFNVALIVYMLMWIPVVIGLLLNVTHLIPNCHGIFYSFQDIAAAQVGIMAIILAMIGLLRMKIKG